MPRYHLNKKGNPGVCKATVSCPFGDINDDHYSSMDEAREVYEKEMQPYFAVNDLIVADPNSSGYELHKRNAVLVEQAVMMSHLNPDKTMGDLATEGKLDPDADHHPWLKGNAVHFAAAVPSLSDRAQATLYSLPGEFYPAFMSSEPDKAYAVGPMEEVLSYVREIRAADPAWRPEPRTVPPRSGYSYVGRDLRSGQAPDMQFVGPHTYSVLEDYVKMKFGEDRADAFWATVHSASANRPKISDFAKAVKKFA